MAQRRVRFAAYSDYMLSTIFRLWPRHRRNSVATASASYCGHCWCPPNRWDDRGSPRPGYQPLSLLTSSQDVVEMPRFTNDSAMIEYPFDSPTSARMTWMMSRRTAVLSVGAWACQVTTACKPLVALSSIFITENKSDSAPANLRDFREGVGVGDATADTDAFLLVAAALGSGEVATLRLPAAELFLEDLFDVDAPPGRISIVGEERRATRIRTSGQRRGLVGSGHVFDPPSFAASPSGHPSPANAQGAGRLRRNQTDHAKLVPKRDAARNRTAKDAIVRNPRSGRPGPVRRRSGGWRGCG